MGIPLCVICCFPLAAFNICYLCLTFVNLINMYLGALRLGFILFGTFNPFTFEVIIDKYDPTSIYFIVLGSGLYTLFVFPV